MQIQIHKKTKKIHMCQPKCPSPDFYQNIQIYKMKLQMKLATNPSILYIMGHVETKTHFVLS